MKTAYYSKKFNLLTFFSQKNVSENAVCYSKKQAIEKIKKSGIEQILILN